MATVADYEARLASVQAAIEKIEGGAQSLTGPNGGTMTRADLGTLYRQEKRLEERIAAANRTAGMRRTVAEF
jgi:hypothetical protein